MNGWTGRPRSRISAASFHGRRGSRLAQYLGFPVPRCVLPGSHAHVDAPDRANATSVARARPPSDLAERFPLVFGVDRDLGALSGDELFTAGVELLLTGLAAEARRDAGASTAMATHQRGTV
jgi:hypothetical protein